jgi:glucose/arabinose dehydrogenase
MRSAAWLALAAGLLAGCGTAQTPPQARPQEQPPPTKITIEPQPLPTLATRQPGQVALPWTLVRAGGNRVVLTASSHGCSRPIGVTVQETPQAVNITVLGNPPGSGACTAQRITLAGYLTTTAPIAGRIVRPGS